MALKYVLLFHCNGCNAPAKGALRENGVALPNKWFYKQRADGEKFLACSQRCGEIVDKEIQRFIPILKATKPKLILPH